MESRPPSFILPNSPLCRVLDRFSDLPEDAAVDEDDYGCIPFWPLLCHLLRRPVSSASQLIDLLQTIGANSESAPDNNYVFLKQFLTSSRFNGDTFFETTWPKLRDIALDAPTYFPDGELGLLQPEKALRLSHGQVACLVVHQFLCSSTPQREDNGYQNFGIWYGSGQRHPSAVDMYLGALFAYFEQLPDARKLAGGHGSSHDEADRYVTFLLHKGQGKVASLEDVSLGPTRVEYLLEHSTQSHLPETQGPGGAVVVSANKVVGFGQSATQEEIFVGIAPEACAVVLVAPHLTDETAVVVSGARAMLNVRGERRDLSWEVRPAPLPVPEYGAWAGRWRGGRLILMDALEMDMVEKPGDVLPDLLPENIDREVRGARCARRRRDSRRAQR